MLDSQDIQNNIAFFKKKIDRVGIIFWCVATVSRMMTGNVSFQWEAEQGLRSSVLSSSCQVWLGNVPEGIRWKELQDHIDQARLACLGLYRL